MDARVIYSLDSVKSYAFLNGLLVLLVLAGCGEAPLQPQTKGLAPVNPPGQGTLIWEAPSHNADGSVLQVLAADNIDIHDPTPHSQESGVIGNGNQHALKRVFPVHRLSVPVATNDRMAGISEWPKEVSQDIPYSSKINFVYASSRKTPTPAGWVEYDGAPYDPIRGFGWLTDLREHGRDRGGNASIELDNGRLTNPQEMGRLELSNWQGRHRENNPLVFRMDLPNKWYKVKCSSVDPGTQLPLVDQRSFKCRAKDVVFVGSEYGAPLAVKGNVLVEGSNIVEVTDGHLRIVVGDPAYAGWTWEHPGPWYSGWPRWIGFEHGYATGWWQTVRRIVDPGFHMVRLNSLEVEPVAPPPRDATVIFHDFFHRDNSLNINEGLEKDRHWEKVKLSPAWSNMLASDIFQASLRILSAQDGISGAGLLQKQISPEQGVVRYSTRVSLFTGEGSQKHSGIHEAGILLLADSQEAHEFALTFVGVGFDGSKNTPQGKFIYRVGDGKNAYRTDLEIPDHKLPLTVKEGEYEIVVLHDVNENAIVQVRLNGVDLIDRISKSDRVQRFSQGLFGLRSVMDPQGSGVEIAHFYWNFRVGLLR